MMSAHIVIDRLHDGSPAEIDRALGEGDVARVEPLLDILELTRRDGIAGERSARQLSRLGASRSIKRTQIHAHGDRRLGKVLEDEDEVKVLEAVLDALEVGDLDLCQGDDEEGRLDEVDQAVGRRLHQHVGSGRDALEAEFAVRDVDLDPAVRGLCDLVRERLEVPVELGPFPPLVLLGLDLVLVPVLPPPLPVARLVEGRLGSLAVELDVERLLLADEDGRLEPDVQDDDELRVARLEEEVLDVAEEDVCGSSRRARVSSCPASRKNGAGGQLSAPIFWS